MKYSQEKDFILQQMRLAYEKHFSGIIRTVSQKTEFDLVTDLDCKIERDLIDAIKKEFPHDKVLSEEFLNTQKITGRTWTIDPIDGTCNLAHGMKLYGIQCALLENSEIVMSAIYLPNFAEEYYALKDGGAYLNNEKISVNHSCELQNAITSFGDYTHKNPDEAKLQHEAIFYLQQKIAKIRMFGAACMDFSYVASGKTDATVVMTKNLWDIAPGILLCQEAGAKITNIYGEKYSFDDIAVVASAVQQLTDLISGSFSKK